MPYKLRRQCVARVRGLHELEERQCLSTISFAAHEIAVSDADGASSVYAVDLDGDRDEDVLSASAFDGKIAWYENIDGRGRFGSQNVISSEAAEASSVFAADVDGDGDVDVLAASRRGVTWYSNTDGMGSFGAQNVISTGPNGASSVVATDVDGDGDVDAIAALQFDGKIAWYENTDGRGNFGPQIVIHTAVSGVESVFATDIDGDGDVDVISASSGSRIVNGRLVDRNVAWYENTDGKGGFGEQRVISTDDDEFRHVYAMDLDADGDVDILSASYDDQAENEIAWYENIDGTGSFGAERQITNGAFGAQAVFAADVDGDGDIDVLSASAIDDRIAWYENTDGQGAFGRQRLISRSVPYPTSLSAADIDGDGDLDALSTSSYGVVSWYENINGEGSQWRQRVIVSAPAYSATSIFAADVDGDGDLDALSAFPDSENNVDIAWYENVDGQGRNWRENIISRRGRSIVVADVDNDGDIDVVSQPTWYENADGQGSLWRGKEINNNKGRTLVADVDGDGDFDVLSLSYSCCTSRIEWYENTDGKGTFGPDRLVADVGTLLHLMIAVDVDADGDMDLLSASPGTRTSTGRGVLGRQRSSTQRN